MAPDTERPAPTSPARMARGSRIVGVDQKLFSDQSIVDLLWKGLEARADRAKAALATSAAEQIAQSVSGGDQSNSQSGGD